MNSQQPQFTTYDRRFARAHGFSLDAPPPAPELAPHDALYNAMATAYQQRDDECARAHVANRELHQQLEDAQALIDAEKAAYVEQLAAARRQRNGMAALLAAYVALTALAAWKGWVTWR